MSIALNTAAPEPQDDFFGALRAGFSFVSARAWHVRIDPAALAAYAAALPSAPPPNLLDETHHFTGATAEETAAYILALDSINFGSGYKPRLKAEGWKLVQGSLYFTVATRLKEQFERHALPATRMAALTGDEVAVMLGLDASKSYSAEFAAMCARALNETGQYAADHHDGRFMGLVDSAGGSAENLVRILAGLKQFHDTALYDGREIGFYKRAQIAAADLQLAFRRTGRELFGDIGRLTMFADNAVPHVLQRDGVLVYTPELVACIAAGQEIPAGSPEEVEIRACAAHAVELMAAVRGMTAMDIDHILWHRSAENPRYAAPPPHRTLTGFY